MYHLSVLRRTFATSMNQPGKKALPDSSADASLSRAALRHDDSGFFALEFGCGRKLAAQKFDVAPGARTTIGPQQSHPIEENEQSKNFGVFCRWPSGAFCIVLLGFVQKCSERSVKLARQRGIRRFFIKDSVAQRFVGFGESMQRGKNIGISRVRMHGGKFRRSKRQP